jgi:hypothetical protein
MIRTQLKGWLFASSACVVLAISPLAHAAHPSKALSPLPALPKAQASSVKALPKENALVPLSSPLRLHLAERKLPPISQARETLILGMRLPTFIAFGLSGLSVGGAVATGYAATRGNDPNTCDSRCTEHGVRQRALLLTTGVLTGMAAAGVSIGLTLMFKAPKKPSRDAIYPRFDLGLTGQKAVAKVGWVFSSF